MHARERIADNIGKRIFKYEGNLSARFKVWLTNGGRIVEPAKIITRINPIYMRMIPKTLGMRYFSRPSTIGLNADIKIKEMNNQEIISAIWKRNLKNRRNITVNIMVLWEISILFGMTKKLSISSIPFISPFHYFHIIIGL